MVKKKFVMGIGAVILSMAIILGIKEGIKIFVAGSTEETQISQDKYEEQDSKILETSGKLDEEYDAATQTSTLESDITYEEQDSKILETASKLGGEYDAATKTLTLKSDITLTEIVSVENSEALTIDMNGKKITGGRIDVNNDTNAPVTFVGKGTIEESRIEKEGAGKLTLNGDIVYKNTKEYVLALGAGTTVIRKGTFYSSEKGIILAVDDWDSPPALLYIKGGIFYGDISLGNNRTYIQKGTIDGTVCCYDVAVYIKGGTIKKGIYASGEDDGRSSIYISGGKILDQIVMDNGYGGKLEISGGTIKSGKSAVIKTNVFEMQEYFYANIKITGGKIISTKENGYGIKAVNTEIVMKGGTIENTTKKGKIGIYSVRYNDKRKSAQVKNADKVTVEGFETDIKNDYKKNYCGENVTYSIDENGTLTISGKGDMFKSMGFFEKDDYQFANKIKNVVVEEGVTGVGGFGSCENIKSVTLPSSVKKIYDDAFRSCSSLEKITMKDGVESIGSLAFNNDIALKEINIPDTVTEIDHQAFGFCNNLQKIHLSNKLTKICYTLFWECDSLESIELPDSVKTISDSAFDNCDKLSNVKLPSKLKKIEKYAFRECVSLKEIKIPSTVKKIGKSAFENCKNLETVEMELSKDAVVDNTAFDNTPYGDKVK